MLYRSIRINPIIAMALAFIIRMFYGYLYGLNFTTPNPAAASYFGWTVVMCVLVGLLFAHNAIEK